MADKLRKMLGGKLKFSEVKSTIWYDGGCATSDDPVAQAASVVRYLSKWHALAVYFYGAAAIACDRIGLNEGTEAYDSMAEEKQKAMETALQWHGTSQRNSAIRKLS